MPAADARLGAASRLRLAALVLLALAVKALFALSLADVFEYGEELEKGTAAKAMLDGLAVPHHALAYHYYEGGGFAVSHLKALAFALVGENLIAHKLVALYFVALVLVAGWGLARRLFGERAATWFGLLFVFGPSSFQKLSLISLGIHFEATVFVLLVLALTARIVFAEGARGAHWLLLGLCAGFGTWFSYQVPVAALYVLPWLALARPKRAFGSGGALGLAGFAIGATPLWVMASLVGRAVLDVHGTSLAGGAPGVPRLERLRAFFASLYLDGAWFDRIGPVVWPLAVAVALGAALLARGEGARTFRARFGFVAGYAGLFALLYLSSNFVVGRVLHFFYLLRLAPLWIACTLLVAAAIARLAANPDRRARALSCALAFVPLGWGIGSAVAIVAHGRPGGLAENARFLARAKGYLYAEYFAKLVPHLAGDDESKLRALLGFHEDARGWLRAEAAGSLFLDPEPDLAGALEHARSVVRRVEPTALAEYELGFGPLFLRAAGWDLGAALRLADALPVSERARVVEALGRIGSGKHPLPEVLADELVLGTASSEPRAFARGAGWRLYASTRFRPDVGERLAQASGPWSDALRAGYEEAARAQRFPLP